MYILKLVMFDPRSCPLFLTTFMIVYFLIGISILCNTLFPHVEIRRPTFVEVGGECLELGIGTSLLYNV